MPTVSRLFLAWQSAVSISGRLRDRAGMCGQLPFIHLAKVLLTV
jgi:hypothetical protein